MRSNRKIARLLMGSLLMSAVIMSSVTSAGAAVGTGSSQACHPQSPSDCVVASGTVVDVVKDSGNPRGGVVVFECNGEAATGVTVTVVSCTAGGVDAPQVALPGPASATVGEFTTTENESYQICWEVQALFAPGAVTTTGCEFLSL